jgi:hypothetical protein
MLINFIISVIFLLQASSWSYNTPRNLNNIF